MNNIWRGDATHYKKIFDKNDITTDQEIAMYPFLFLSLQDTCITLMRNKLNNTSSITSSTRLRMSDVNEYGLSLCAPVDYLLCLLQHEP